MAQEKKLYYSIRVVETENYYEAVEKVRENIFEEADPLCDKILTISELTGALQYRRE